MIFTLTIFVWAEACSPTPDLSGTGLVVDPYNTSITEDGSECMPFKALDSAVSLANTSGGGAVRLVNCPWIVDLTTDIEADLAIFGSTCSIKVNASIQVNAQLSISEMSMLQGAISGPAFNVNAPTRLFKVKVQGFTVDFVHLASSLDVEQAEFANNSAVVVKSISEEITFKLKDSTVATSGSFFSWESFVLNNLASTIELSGSSFTTATSTLISVTQNSVPSRPSSLLIRQCSFVGVLLIADVKALGLTTSIQNCTITASRLLELSQTTSTTLIQGCTITNTVGNNILVRYLDGLFSLVSTTVVGVTNGSFLFIANSKGVLSKAQVLIQSFKLTNLLGRLPENYVVRLDNVLATIKDVEFASIDTTSCKC